MERKAKKLNCLSSYWGLNRFSLGQISELLRLTKESYCSVKLKCPDTGQHTVLFRECTVTDLRFLNKAAVPNRMDAFIFFNMLWNWHCPTDLSRPSAFNSSNSSSMISFWGSRLRMMTPSVLLKIKCPPPPYSPHPIPSPSNRPKKCKFLPRAARLLK